MSNRLRFFVYLPLQTILAVLLLITQAQAQTPLSIPLYDRLPEGRRIGYWVKVQAGGGSSGIVLLDTGSKGLMIMSSQLGNDYKRTGRRMKQSFHDGTIFEGEIVKAPLVIGPAATVEPIFIMAVDAVSCARDRPNCPAETFKKKPLAGIMGVGMGKVASLDHPLGYFGNLRSNGFIIRGAGKFHPPTLTLGLNDASRDGFTLYAMPKLRLSLNWRDAFFAYNSIDGCLRVDSERPFEQCGKILLDSGSSMNLIRMPNPVETGPGGLLRDGTAVRVSISGQPDILVKVDGKAWSQRYVVSKDTSARMILGGSFFERFDVLYDLNRNALGLKPTQ